MKQILPICIENSLPTECWSYYRFAIIEAYPHLIPWMVQHYQHIFSGYGWEVFHGQNGAKYDQLTYYSDALITHGMYHEEVSSSDLIPFIREKINQGLYPLIECDYSLLLGKEPGHTHEVLVYGYDDENQFIFFPFLKNVKWKSKTVGYADFQRAFASFDHLSSNTIDLSLFRREYLYPVTLLSPRKEFHTEYSPFILFNDLRDIGFQAYQIYETYNTADDSICPAYYGYLGVYNALLIAAGRILVDEEFRRKYRYAENLNRLHVYRQRFGKNMKFLLSQFTIPYDDSWFVLDKEIVQNLNCCVMLGLKYEQTGDLRHIPSIHDYMLEIFQKEQQLFNLLYEAVRKWIVIHY
ncbi:MAG: hypothetical protein HFJ79_04740 [Clostridiales bacterium]|nr:hypothetical protein [Clostridiales bacterium]